MCSSKSFYNRDLVVLLISHALLTLGAYTFLALIILMSGQRGALSLFTYAAGLPLIGACTSFFVERRRRNSSCIITITLIAIVQTLWQHTFKADTAYASYTLPLWTLAIGMLFGLSNLILQGTLITDVTPSASRQRAHRSTLTIVLLAMLLSPFLAHVGYNTIGCSAPLAAAALTTLSALFVGFVRFPFRSPEDKVTLLSLDRFLYLRKPLLAAGIFLTSALYAYMATVDLSMLSSMHITWKNAIRLAIATAIYLPLLHALYRIYLKGLQHCMHSTIHNTFWLVMQTGCLLGIAVACSMQ